MSALTLQDRFEMPVPPLFSWRDMLDYFLFRLIPGVEVIEGQALRQAVRLPRSFAVIEVKPTPARKALGVHVFSARETDRDFIAARLTRQFDLDAPMRKVNEALKRHRALGALIKARPGLRVPGAFDPYLLAMRAILGQQVSVKGATTLTSRLVERYGEPIAQVAEEGLWPRALFPAPERLAGEVIEGLGMPGKRAATLTRLAGFAADGGFGALESDTAPLKTLEALPGIGPWTAHYVGLRALHLRDAFPSSDLGLRYAAGDFSGAVPSARELEAMSRAWSPYRGHAAIHLWASLQTGTQGAKGG
jgi:3-methyladenine DNA glycosylase/8-oxoguanine DNA glycosylase